VRALPDIAVVVPSHDRPLRLRWLLNALEEQTLPHDRWEVIVGHDSAGPQTERLLREHPLARRGVLRHVTLPPGSAPPGANRNAAWRLARAPLIAFTDDDCRPPPDWLARVLAAAQDNPGAIVQGATFKDPDEINQESAAQYHSQTVRPPTPWAEACNIVYPREVLERLGGFNEEKYTGEDCELALRARADGVPYVPARDAVTYHAVVEITLPERLRGIWRWQDLPWVVREHPELREAFPLWIFWKREHVWFPFAVAGAVLERRNVLWGLLAVPWLIHATPRRGNDPRGRLRGLAELPGRAAVVVAEYATLLRGSAKYRSLLL
jgi:glycosyltransferase involved in cell wall biosynthesis